MIWAHIFDLWETWINRGDWDLVFGEDGEHTARSIAGDFGPVPSNDHSWWDPLGY